MAAPKVRSFSEAAEAAGIPVQINREQIAELGVVTWLSAEQSEAANPQTGVKEPGFLVTIQTDSGRKFTSFVGNVVLTRLLAELEFPFRARLVRNGRTWVFAD